MNVVSVYSPTSDQCDSYGRLAQELSSGLRSLGYDHVNEFAVDDEREAPSIVASFGGFLLGHPTNFHKYGQLPLLGPRIGVTMWESSELPPYWADNLNKCNAVIVPSEWLIPVFRRAGVTVPITVIPLGISSAYKYEERVKDRPFTFLVIGDRGFRKGRSRAIRAFYAAFGEDERYRLIVKGRKNQGFPTNISNKNIIVVSDDLTDEGMALLYASCDALVFPTCGEGFGLPPREFAATGGISLATCWGGTADDIHSWGIPLDYTLVKAWQDNKGFKDIGFWALTDEDVLVERMIEVSRLSYAERVFLGVTFSRNVSELYKWEAFSQKCSEVWDSVSKGAA